MIASSSASKHFKAASVNLEMEESTECPNWSPTEVPEEIWEYIFDELDKPEDLHSCYNACSTFHHILERRHINFLFERTLPLLQNYVSRNDILNCRLASHKWQAIVDNHLQRSYFHFKPANLDPDECLSRRRKKLINPCRRKYHFYSAEKVDKFLAHLESYSGPNPIITRAVEINVDPLDEVGFIEKAGDFVSKYGSHIWYLKLIYVNIFDLRRILAFYENVLVKWFHAMPHLRSLRLFLLLPKVQGPAIESCIEDNPLSTLEHLQHLSMYDSNHRIGREVLKAWASRGCLTHLQVSEFSNFDQGFVHDISDVESKFEGLEAIDVPMPRLDYFVILSSIQSKRWLLKKLVLRDVSLSESGVNGKVLTFPVLFQALNLSSFANTLQKLSLLVKGCAKYNGRKGPCKDLTLKLPALQILKIKGKGGFIAVSSFHFAFELKSLKSLHLIHVRSECYIEDIFFTLISYNAKPGDKTLWDMLPALKRVEIVDGSNNAWECPRPWRRPPVIPRSFFRRVVDSILIGYLNFQTRCMEHVEQKRYRQRHNR